MLHQYLPFWDANHVSLARNKQNVAVKLFQRPWSKFHIQATQYAYGLNSSQPEFLNSCLYSWSMLDSRRTPSTLAVDQWLQACSSLQKLKRNFAHISILHLWTLVLTTTKTWTWYFQQPINWAWSQWQIHSNSCKAIALGLHFINELVIPFG